MSRWRWTQERSRLGRDNLPGWLRALSAAVPWVTAIVLYALITKIDGVFSLDNGALLDLPKSSVGDLSDTTAVAFMLSTDEGTLLFFDDTRYVFADRTQMEKFAMQLEQKISFAPTSTPVLLVLADKSIPSGQLHEIAATAKKCGVAKIMFAEKRSDYSQQTNSRHMNQGI